ncbi:MAG: Ca2+/Na+ antiporter [Halocynthiibacter sp.]|jgi:Ca2+/Na+ antiporter
MQANESSLSEVVQILPVMILVFLLMGVFLYIKIATENRRNRVLRRDDHSLDTHGLARILNRLERMSKPGNFGGGASGGISQSLSESSAWGAHRVGAMDANRDMIGAMTAQSGLKRKVFQSSFRLRLAAMVPVALVAMSILPEASFEAQSLARSIVVYMLIFVFALVALYYLVWIFRYEVEIDGSRLRYRDLTFKVREFDLNELMRVRHDGRYIYVLTFAGNHSFLSGLLGANRARIFKEMTDSQELKSRLLDFVELSRKI